jgi:hypothetical protein
VVATFTTANREAIPLSTGQKFQLFFKSAMDPWPFLLAAVLAGTNQAQNSFPAYGQGVRGYAKRFGATTLSGISWSFSFGDRSPETPVPSQNWRRRFSATGKLCTAMSRLYIPWGCCSCERNRTQVTVKCRQHQRRPADFNWWPRSDE